MDKRIAKLVDNFSDDVAYCNNLDDKETFFNRIRKRIIEKTNEYYQNNNKAEIVEDLGRLYDLYYYIKSQKNINDTYNLDQELSNLPPVYIINQKPIKFDIDKELLNNIDISNGLTIDEALNLLKWISNNTRDNLNKYNETLYIFRDVYEDAPLNGTCGLGQFISLYPLQQLGLHITINNIQTEFKTNHAYGTVVIPIKEENKVTNKRFILDLTYRQFFRIHENVISKYLKSNSKPNIGLFINLDEDDKNFAIELLKNGFVEATDDNIKHYFKPFAFSDLELYSTDTINQVYQELDMLDAIENKQIEFDWDIESAKEYGYNLDLPIKPITK